MGVQFLGLVLTDTKYPLSTESGMAVDWIKDSIQNSKVTKNKGKHLKTGRYNNQNVVRITIKMSMLIQRANHIIIHLKNSDKNEHLRCYIKSY